MDSRTQTVGRRRLATELRKLRDAAGLTIEDVAARLDCSSSKVSRIETASVRPTPRDVRDMLQIYGVTGQRLDELQQIAREARQKGGLYAQFQNLSYKTLCDLEADAESVDMYSALLVPGLLQIPDYARAVLRAVCLHLKPQPEEIERRVEFRLLRQARLTEKERPALWVVLDEAALRRLVGGREVMRAQLDHLREVAALSFTVISFPDPFVPDVVFIENTTSDLYLEDAGAIRRYVQSFDHLRAAALDPGESVAFLTNVAKEL